MALFRDYSLTGTGVSKALAGANLAFQLANALRNEGFTVTASTTNFTVNITAYRAMQRHLDLNCVLSGTTAILNYNLDKRLYNPEDNYYMDNYTEVSSTMAIASTYASGVATASLKVRVFYLTDGGILLCFLNKATNMWGFPGVYWTQLLALDRTDSFWIIGFQRMNYSTNDPTAPFQFGNERPFYINFDSTAPTTYETTDYDIMQIAFFGPFSPYIMSDNFRAEWYSEAIYICGQAVADINYIAIKVSENRYFLHMYSGQESVNMVFKLEDR